ncbi:MAG: ABC transporter permease subunit [Candidatus Adiutrix sp.]|jgi:NitT/TauT family transport system permease protein|nr:ABC transporter permease subunit [Candidatus Adiutrix sp.]
MKALKNAAGAAHIKWKALIFKALPHLMFIALLLLISSPSLVELKVRGAFAAVAVMIELALLCNWRSRSAHDLVMMVFAFLIVWEVVTTKIPNPNKMLFPPPENVFAIYYTDWKKIISGIFSSLFLLAYGAGLAFVSGIVLGLTVGWHERLRQALFPVAKVISPIPPIIYTPYAVALLPSFKIASIFVIFSSIFWYLFLNMIISVATIDKKLLDSARSLNISPWGLMRHILFPYCLPGIFKTLPISMANAFMVLTAAEMIGATSGLGWFVKYYSDFSDFTRVVAGIVLIGLVVSVIGALLARLDKLVIRWR